MLTCSIQSWKYAQISKLLQIQKKQRLLFKQF